jgi:hypothetical protein
MGPGGGGDGERQSEMRFASFPATSCRMHGCHSRW